MDLELTRKSVLVTGAAMHAQMLRALNAGKPATAPRGKLKEILR
jgi:hypothetical protein